MQPGESWGWHSEARSAMFWGFVLGQGQGRYLPQILVNQKLKLTINIQHEGTGTRQWIRKRRGKQCAINMDSETIIKILIWFEQVWRLEFFVEQEDQVPTSSKYEFRGCSFVPGWHRTFPWIMRTKRPLMIIQTQDVQGMKCLRFTENILSQLWQHFDHDIRNEFIGYINIYNISTMQKETFSVILFVSKIVTLI